MLFAIFAKFAGNTPYRFQVSWSHYHLHHERQLFSIFWWKAGNLSGHAPPMCWLSSSLSVTHNFSCHQGCVLRIHERILATWQPKSSDILLISAIFQHWTFSFSHFFPFLRFCVLKSLHWKWMHSTVHCLHVNW